MGIDMLFGDKLIQLRRESGYSQEQLANQLKVSRQAVSKWEAGNSVPELEKIVAIADIFGVSVDYLVREDRNSVEQAIPINTEVTNQAVLTQLDEIKQSIKRQYVYEYKSKRVVLGIPLVHIKCARNGIAVAKGIIAIGNTSIGVISIGGAAIGLISVGGFALGLLTAIAGIAVGGVSFAGISMGVLAFGGIATGEIAVGAIAVASKLAIGAVAKGSVAIGSVVEGTHTLIAETATKAQIQELIMEQYPKLGGIVKWIVSMLK